MQSSVSVFAALAFSLAGCADSAVDVGDATVGSTTYHISREGDPAGAGVMTRFVIKPTTADKPTTVVGWVGLASADGSTKFPAVFDSNDGDFDDDLTCPSPLPDGSKFYFSVTTGATAAVGSVELK